MKEGEAALVELELAGVCHASVCSGIINYTNEIFYSKKNMRRTNERTRTCNNKYADSRECIYDIEILLTTDNTAT